MNVGTLPKPNHVNSNRYVAEPCKFSIFFLLSCFCSNRGLILSFDYHIDQLLGTIISTGTMKLRN